MTQSTKFVVFGCGSIGRRHISNLLDLGIDHVLAFDPRADRREQTRSELKVTTADSFGEIWEYNPEAAIISAPTGRHIPLAIEAARHGCHLFIEKPLGDGLKGVEELASSVTSGGLIVLVGCNMRFHHGPSTIKRLLSEGAVGKVTSALIDTGQYLPDWHPDEDYRQGYSANASLGGGVVLDAIHEIDYARWLFGEVAEVYAQGGKFSSLDIDTEDTANILFKTVDGPQVSIHLDYIQRTYSRSCKVIGEEGTIIWEMSQGGVRIYSASDNAWVSFPEPSDYHINQMYIDEMRHFLRCLQGEDEPCLGLEEAARDLEIALAVKESMRTGEPQTVAV